MTLTLDSSPQNIRNILVKFGQGAFFAHHAADVDVATATVVKLTVDTEIVDVCSWFADSVFTPKMPGYYLLFGSAFITADTDWSADKYAKLFIRKNGATPAYFSRSAAVGATSLAASGSLSVTAILEANGTTDYFDFAASHDDDGTISVGNISFGGVLVSYNKP